MNAEAVSVIIPTYNRTEFLERAVRSVLTQTLPALEIVIIDDGSDPRHLNELTRISKLSTVISLHHLPVNTGLSHARNYGISVSRGDYLLFLDDDDALDPKMLETGASVLREREEIDIVTFGCKILSDTKDRKGRHQVLAAECYRKCPTRL